MFSLWSTLPNEIILIIVTYLDDRNFFYIRNDPFFIPFVRIVQARSIRKWRKLTKVTFIVDAFEDSLIYNGNITILNPTEFIIKEQSLDHCLFLMSELIKKNNGIVFVIENNL